MYHFTDSLLEDFTESMDNAIIVYNGTDDVNLNYFDLDFNRSKEIGIHCGTFKAAKALGYRYINKLKIDLSNVNIYVCDFDITSSWQTLELAQIYLKDKQLIANLRKNSAEIDKDMIYSSIYRKWFLDQGYSVIKYVNQVEDIGSTSYIILVNGLIKEVNSVQNL